MDIDDLLRSVFSRAEIIVIDWVEKKIEMAIDYKFVCSSCREPMSGTVLIHHSSLSGGEVLFHLSCLNAPTNYKALILHYGREHDRLIFTEEVKSDGKEEDDVCLGCDKPVFGPGYKCSSSSECNLLLHKSCFELSPQVQYPFHPNHTLFLMEAEKKYCNACGKNCNRYPFYCCRKCDFNLDITCATRPRINNIHDCQHAFTSVFNWLIQFTCQACGEEGKEIASLCSICQLLIHRKCARFSRIIKIARHDHSLALTYSLRQVKEHLDNNIFCKLCYQEVKTEYAAYYCQEYCGYVAHLDCAFEDEESANLNFLPKESVDLATDVMQVEGVGQIRHFSHQHDLILSNEELTDDKLCDGCMGLISTPFYSCTQCSFFLHSRCAQLPRKKRHPLHQHELTLSSERPDIGGIVTGKPFSCNACKHGHHGFTYRCNICDFDLDLQCCSISETLKHEGHQHSLFLAVNSKRSCHACNCSTSNKEPGIFVCINCDFALGFKCATLPLVARRHKYDDHLLRLTYSVEAHCEEYYCLICEKVRDPNDWFYYCVECDFSAHSQCVLGKHPYLKFGSSFTQKEVHQHPLTFVSKTESSRPCDVCGETFNDGFALECTQCKSNVHPQDSCITRITKSP